MMEVLLRHAVMEHLGWTLLHALWQGLVLAAVFALAFRVARAWSSAQRHALAVAALVLWLAVPAATFLVITLAARATPSDLSALAAAQVEAPSASAGPAEEATLDIGAEHGAVVPAAESVRRALGASIAELRAVVRPVAPPLRQLLPLAALTWLAISALLAIRLGASLFLVLRWRATARPVPSLQPLVDALAFHMSVRGCVLVARSEAVDSPSVIGGKLAVILLPPCTLSGFSDDQLRLVVAHELAHLKRRDGPVNLLQAVAGVTLFFHPLTTSLRNVLGLEAEKACDDTALEVTGLAPLRLAETLAGLERRRRTPIAALAVRGPRSQLETRVRRLLGHAPLRAAHRTILPFLGVTVVTLWLATGAAQEASPTPASTEKALVVIDPGHGGGTGANGFVSEEAVILPVALKLAERLEANGVGVLLTRANDETTWETSSENMATRVALAEGSDLLVSLHAAAGTSSTSNGIVTWVPRMDSGIALTSRQLASRAAAERTHPRLIAATGATDLGIKANDFYVLRNASVPAVLYELGFVTNAEEATLLASEEYQDTVADALAAGILDYLSAETDGASERRASSPVSQGFDLELPYRAFGH